VTASNHRKYARPWRASARRITENAALLADEVVPQQPLRQRELSPPFALSFLLATHPRSLTRELGIVYRTLPAHILRKARHTRATGATGAATLVQRFGSALNFNTHFLRPCGRRMRSRGRALRGLRGSRCTQASRWKQRSAGSPSGWPITSAGRRCRSGAWRRPRT
jgi:hypothetical protein